MRKRIFQLFAIFFFVTAVYHFAGLFYPVNDSPKWRHALFVGINLMCVYGMLKRPNWFAYFFFVLLIQQLNAHGNSLVDAWIETHRISWIDLSAVLFTPLMFLMLVSDRVNNKQ